MTEQHPRWRPDGEGEAVGGDPFTTYDAAYVLGALSPEDRVAFEEHMRGCDACSHRVLGLAAMPGLLAQGKTSPGWAEAPPETLLPSLLGNVRRFRLRRRAGLIGAVSTAVAACVVATVILFSGGSERDVNPGREMTALRPIPVQARASLTGLSGGTRVDMSCSYRGGRGGDYLLVAVRRDGTDKTLAEWNAIPEDTARISVGTTLQRADIDALEIRLPDGTPLLRLTP